MEPIPLYVKDWSAWMPGISSPDEWKQWAIGKKFPQAGVSLPTPSIAPMLRRRLSSLGRVALSVALPLLNDKCETPCVFCSRHGDLERTVKLLTNLAEQEPLSPTHFSLSVPNAIGGLMSMIRSDPSNITALAIRNGELAVALLEASAIMRAQASDQVLCVIYDGPLPEIYGQQTDSGRTINIVGPEWPYGVAFLLVPQAYPGGHELHSNIEDLSQRPLPAGVSGEPQALTLLRFMLASGHSEELTMVGKRQVWRWSKEKLI